ncbi:MAG: MFS transporter [Spirochaetales bacterium]|nr:MFS transporter [Spirochaetales bacterium]
MIKKTKYLSQKERETARKYYFRFVSFNGVSFSFLGNTTVYLLAILYGATNLQLGYISAAAYITGGLLIFYPRLFRGRSSKQVGYIAWMLRGLVCLGYLILPFLKGPSAVWIILITYTLFCITRTIGVAIQQSIQKMISTSRTRGEVVMTASTRFNSIALVSRFFSYILTSLHFLSELAGILTLQMIGVLANTFASLNLKKMPNREVVDYEPGQHIGKILKEAFSKKREKTILLLRWSAICIEILTAMTVPFLRQFAGFTAAQVFMYTVIITVSSVGAALMIRPFADRMGSRPFILPSGIAAGLLFFTWMTISPERSPEFFYILGFLTVFIQNILSLLTARLFIQSIPDEGSVSFTSMDIVVTSILALLLGFIAGGLADLGTAGVNLPLLNVYGLTFALALLICVFITIVAAGFYEKGSATMKKTWTMLFSIEHMRTFRDISRLSSGNNTHKRKTLILSLAYTGSSLANEEIRQMFHNPISSEKSDIMKTLFERKRPDLIPDLIREAEEIHSLYRQEAIFALGAYPSNRVEKALIKLLDDPDSLTASNAAKSLGRIGHTDSMRKIYDRYINGRRGNITRDLNYLIALHNMAPDGDWMESLFSKEISAQGETYEQSLYTLFSRQRNMSPPLGWIYQMNNMEQGEGIHILLDETREMDLFFQAQPRLYASYSEQDFRALWIWCQEILRKVQNPGKGAAPLIRSILNFDASAGNSSNSIAVLYYTYQILSEGGAL